jgi:hypothetical protein
VPDHCRFTSGNGDRQSLAVGSWLGPIREPDELVQIDGAGIAPDVRLAVGEELSVRRCDDSDSVTSIFYGVELIIPVWSEEELNTLHIVQIVPPSRTAAIAGYSCASKD